MTDVDMRKLTSDEILELVARMIKEEQEKHAKLLALIEDLQQESKNDQ